MMFKKSAGNFLLPITYCLLFSALLSCKFRQKADLVIHHAKIYTADTAFSTAEAMAIMDGKIIAIGTNDKILKEYDLGQTWQASIVLY